MLFINIVYFVQITSHHKVDDRTFVTQFYGISQDPETKNYIMVLDYAKHFQQNFSKWSSGNVDIDKFIQDTQLSANYHQKVLEWIPYDRFYDIEYIAKGGFGKVYRANWIDGPIYNWDIKNQNWEHYGSNMLVALKSLDNSKNVTLEFLNEV